jgi:hypothetical protein
MPPIKLRRSTTPDAVPTAAQLVSGELAINPADGRLYMKLESGAVIRISAAISINTVVSPTTWSTTSTYSQTSNSQQIDLSGRLNHKVSATPNVFSPFIVSQAFIRIPINSSIAIQTGYSIWVEQAASGTVDFNGDSGVSVVLPAGKRATTSTTGALVRLLKTATNAWSLTGDLDNI